MDANVAALGPKSHGLTPLHLAAKGGHIKVMDELLEHGANIDARTKGACGCKKQYPSFSHNFNVLA
ncbi:putative ankyrin repeat-containing domain-containing protein [Helianthus debilis subsp. tardiflorus]